MKNTKSLQFFTFISVALISALVSSAVIFATATTAYASITPTLTLTNLGNGTVQANVSGDADATITLYYSSTFAGIIGSTAQNGYLSTPLSVYANNSSGTYNYTYNYNNNYYNIPFGAPVYVIVNGLESNVVSWPYNGNGVVGTVGTVGTPYFSVSNINLTVGQSQSVQIYQGQNYNGTTYNAASYPYSGTYYISSNANTSVVSTSLSGSSLSVYALAPGTASVTVCESGVAYPLNTYNSYNYTYNTTNNPCATLYITVTYANGYNNYTGYTGYTGYNNSYPYGYSSTPSVYSYPTVQYTPQYIPQYTPATVYNNYPVYSYPNYYPTYPSYYP